MTRIDSNARAALTVTNTSVAKIQPGDTVVGRWAVDLHTVEKVERAGRMYRVTLSGIRRPVTMGPAATMKRVAA